MQNKRKCDKVTDNFENYVSTYTQLKQMHEEQNAIEEEEEEESDYDEIIHVNQIEDDLVTQFITQQNEFYNHLTVVADCNHLGAFKEIEKQNDYVLLSTNYNTQIFYQLCDIIKKQYDKMYSVQLRRQFQLHDEAFHNKIVNLVLSRRSLIVTSNSFQHRQQMRETVCSCIASYLVNKFGHITLSFQKNNQRKMKYTDDDQVNLKQILNNNQHEPSVSDNKDLNDQPQQYTYNGFVRPQVLILTNSRHNAWRITSYLLELFPNIERKNIGRFKKFEQKYAPDTDTIQYEVGGIQLLPDEIPDQLKDKVESKKPFEWLQHYTGNQDQDFCLTLAIHKRGPHAILLDQPIDKADVIIASPSGLLEYKSKSKMFIEDYLSSLHTVFIDSIDYIIDNQFLYLKKLLSKMFIRPKIILNQNILTISDLFIQNMQSTGCQTVIFQQQESELVNGLFSDKDIIYPTPETRSQHIYHHEQTQQSASVVKINLNSYGLQKLKYFNENYTQLKNINFIYTTYLLTNQLSFRKTDLLPYNCLKFDIKNYPTVDYTINYLLSGLSSKQVVIYAKDTFTFLRLKSVLTKTKQEFLQLNENMEATQIGRTFSQFVKGKTDLLLVSESFMYQRMTLIKSQKLIFVGVPNYQIIFRDLLKNCSGDTIVLFTDEDYVRLQNIVDLNVYKELVVHKRYQVQ